MPLSALAPYLADLPQSRRARIDALVELVLGLYPHAEVSLKYRMPTFETDTGWVALANQKSYVSFYTCSAIHIEGFKATHPGIKTGKGCINFRDRDEIPLSDLEPVVRRAMASDH